MSHWAYIDGTITVTPFGRTQPEKRYILDTVLDHLPAVTGSEGNMNIHIVQKAGHDVSSSCNEFGEWVGCRNRHSPWMRTQSEYMLVLEANLRDRTFDQTKMELNKWLNRLAKRVGIEKILVRLSSYDKEMIISNAGPYSKMVEWPSWCDESNGEPAWAEYLMWDSAKDTRYPMKLAYKYYDDPENDAEVERRMAYNHG